MTSSVGTSKCGNAASSLVFLLSLMSLSSLLTPANGQSIAETPDGYNCESLSDDFQVRWRIDGGNIDIELLAEIPDDTYMAFGVSGSADGTNMIGADVVVADIPTSGGGAQARDFYMDLRSPCNGAAGVCPDTDGGFSDDVTNVSGEKDSGLTLVRYTRPLNPSDGQAVDKAIPINGQTFIAWALGPMNAGNPGFHGLGYAKQDGADVTLEFGRSVVDNCIPLVEVNDAPPPPFHRPFVGDSETWIDAHIGPAGGPRGYEAIRGVPSFGGLAWYLNGVLIPELVLRRGRTYNFRVSGGDSHPFYLTDSPTGGYAQLTQAERDDENVFAGIVPTWGYGGGDFETPGVGPICRYEETAATPGKELASFSEYVETLDRSCANDQWLLNQAGVITFTPDQWTPDVIYYQCVTHANLGFKVSVIDEWDPEATSSPTVSPTDSPTRSAAADPVVQNGDGNDPDDLVANGFTALALEGQLLDSNLFFKFNPADPAADGQDTVTVVLEVPVLAWAGVGFSDNGGFMVGSEAVIGLPNTGEVLKYNLNAKNLAGVVPMPQEQQTLINTSIVQTDDGTTILSFTKILDEPGEILINLEDDNTFLSAYGLGNDLGIHAARVSFTLEGAELETRKQNLWIVHGWLAAFAWAGLSPLAIISSIFRQFIPIEGLWFKLHRALNMAVVTFTLAAFIVAVAAINQETPAGAKAGHFDKSLSGGHRSIGLVIFLLAFLQGLGGILRPHAPEKPKTDDVDKPAACNKTRTRLAWEIGHRGVGLGLLILCWYQVTLGVQAYGDIFNGGDADSVLTAVFAIIGSFAIIIAIGYIIKIATAFMSNNRNQSSSSPSSSSANRDVPVANSDDNVVQDTTPVEDYNQVKSSKPANRDIPAANSNDDVVQDTTSVEDYNQVKSSKPPKSSRKKSKSPTRSPRKKSKSPKRSPPPQPKMIDPSEKKEEEETELASPRPQQSRQASLGLDGFRDSRMAGGPIDP